MERMVLKCFLACVVTILISDPTLADERVGRKLSRSKRFIEMADDVSGPFCATRPDGQCCPGRDDTCTVPILDSTCYCDVFCNETASDCCPDFFSFCHGINPEPITRGCQRAGQEYPINYVITENCNSCTCIVDPAFQNQQRWNCTKHVCLIQTKLIGQVNSHDSGWRAGNYSAFWGMTLDEGIRYRLGTIPPDADVRNMKPVRGYTNTYLPDDFDSRIQWPGRIHPIRDQGNCGASWAFSTVATASDRLAIESDGILQEELSPQHLLSCNTARGQLGCEGGYLDKAWWFLRKKGIVSEDCYPYVSGSDNEAGMCMLRNKKDANTAPCPNGQANSTGRILYSTPPYRISDDERDIMNEIYKNGPVQAIMRVKEDFFMYQSGIYQYTNTIPDLLPDDDDRGYHSVRIIGWGIETDTTSNTSVKYWLCANSWGHLWGDNGYFRVRRGVNECSVEEFVIASCWSSPSFQRVVPPSARSGVYLEIPSEPGLLPSQLRTIGPINHLRGRRRRCMYRKC
ncbi:tubulointerstitial nephritis antigen-like isoform X1 [Ylistrum balloti]|uniref:tubulointerstitial nephritis antigen-like isoform X1 n=1 Tax=Ylistrum balloti TaxID=509963 RepID=UPI002905965D|nr:tubulointerstitial nephritis antigen-like isoform X1 [Ylistrum balloti]